MLITIWTSIKNNSQWKEVKRIEEKKKNEFSVRQKNYLKMDNEKRKDYNRKAIPFIQIDSPSASKRQSYISVSSSEESIPVDAPLARQSRCSVDIDTVPTKLREKCEINGIDRHSSTYLDNSELRESIQDIT